MVKSGETRFSPRDVIAVVMGGGVGTRLFPLTLKRAKPAVPLGGKYRLVDIPISNCINSEIKRIFLLTQYNTQSLHQHVQHSYRFDDYSEGFVEILAAQQTPSSSEWYLGTADSVRQNLNVFDNFPHELVLILSGDQLYRFDFRFLIEQHLATHADVTVATIPVKKADVGNFGIMQVDAHKRTVSFVEKPKDTESLKKLRIEEPILSSLNVNTKDDLFLASMGIYVFNRKTLTDALVGAQADFGHHIIPQLISTAKVFSYIYQGYWEDIGTIKSFYEANLDLTEPVPKFNFFDVGAPIYSRGRYLPASKIVRSQIERVIIAEGCIIMDAKIEHSVIGIRSRIHEGTTIIDTIIMGQDYYETDAQLLSAEAHGVPRIGIGKNCFLHGVIVDKNARIGENVRITRKGKPAELDGDNFYVRDGIVIIPKSAVIPNDTVI
jgi:glucose-1-phosphate adenylyltransferase